MISLLMLLLLPGGGAGVVVVVVVVVITAMLLLLLLLLLYHHYYCGRAYALICFLTREHHQRFQYVVFVPTPALIALDVFFSRCVAL